MTGPPYKFPNFNESFPEFYSFWPDEDDENLRELHYAVLGVNGPVYLLQEDASKAPKHTTMWDMWMEDRAVGLEWVPFEDSKWSEHYYHPDNVEYREHLAARHAEDDDDV